MVPLPRELEEDILSRLPAQSLVRFRSVCKRWNALFYEKGFINHHFARARPQFICMTNSNIYSIDIIGLDGVDPTINLLDLPSKPYYRKLDFNCISITTCDGFLFCNSFPIAFVFFCPGMTKGTALWNPWLKQVKWNDFEDKDFDACVAIYDCTSQAFKFIDTPNEDWSITDVQRSSVSLNGNLYWISPIPVKFDFCEFLIRSFDFSRDIFKPFCLLPCRKMDFCDLLVLQVFNENRLSLLKQCYKTRKVEIWVTKKKIDSSNYNSGEEVVWISLLTFPSSNLPNLCNKRYDISYFIYDKTTLIMCCGDDGGGTPCIYIVRGDFFKKIQINSGVFRCCHCIYAPNFIPVPLGSDCKPNNFITFS
ncbi:hypothetical protein ARALYDRAFT_897971 [Arabidopsis lyrata subsp. lyrata]|uniref:F-box domain-containing protein n=1 Tax=Arabidopsis lyrata subsp. lyrata TaxID=81972 RepID=D7L641_ARALL|nr:hypothetical protein ARALYDRAFT_897971 [Arabidopsis lyrata subsp. lyrata]